MIKNVWGVTFFVSNLDKAMAFYEKTLGLNKKYQYSSYAGFDCGGIEIGLIPKENMKREEDAPVVELIVDNVDETCRALKAKGVEFVKEPHDETWGGRQATFLDLDGNRLEITQIQWQKYFNIATKGFEKT
jgi:catechol 2,3-dioxygenase-like lactoylglutathione lyase family enzyme